MTKQILITKEKGGVASTTTAVNLAYDSGQPGLQRAADRYGYSGRLCPMPGPGPCAGVANGDCRACVGAGQGSFHRGRRARHSSAADQSQVQQPGRCS